MPIRKRLRSLWATVRSRVRRLPRVPQLTPADVTIVVLNWNNRDVTLECVESLRGADLQGATTLVVDNGSLDGSMETFRATFPPEVKLLPLPENVGYAGGNNAGTRAALAAGASAVLLLNNDTKVATDFLHPLLAVLNEHADAAAVSSAIMRMDTPEVLQEAYFEVYYGFGLIRRRGVNALPGEGFDRVRAVDAAIGCSLLVRREVLEHVGLLDESYFAYHEEVEWCVRTRKAGWRIFYQPYSRVYHHFSKSTDVRRPPPLKVRQRGTELPNPIPLQWNPVRTYLGARNSIRFIRRHASLWRKVYFYVTTLYAIPLEGLAAVCEREEELKLGLLTYRRALGGYCLEQSGTSLESLEGRWPSIHQVLRALAAAPRALGRDLPADVRRARAAGRLRQVEACIRGHLDGMRDAPVPLEALGLRPPRPTAPGA
jgi:GT2 family glycosyltransferase